MKNDCWERGASMWHDDEEPAYKVELAGLVAILC